MVQWSNVFACKSRKVQLSNNIGIDNILRIQLPYVPGNIGRNIVIYLFTLCSRSECCFRWTTLIIFYFGHTWDRFFDAVALLVIIPKVPDKQRYRQTKLVVQKPTLVNIHSSLIKMIIYSIKLYNFIILTHKNSSSFMKVNQN